MHRAMKYAILGSVLAIAITTAMDATGYSMFSALPLFPLAAIFGSCRNYLAAKKESDLF